MRVHNQTVKKVYTNVIDIFTLCRVNEINLVDTAPTKADAVQQEQRLQLPQLHPAAGNRHSEFICSQPVVHQLLFTRYVGVVLDPYSLPSNGRCERFAMDYMFYYCFKT